MSTNWYMELLNVYRNYLNINIVSVTMLLKCDDECMW